MDKINGFFFHWVRPFIPQKNHNQTITLVFLNSTYLSNSKIFNVL